MLVSFVIPVLNSEKTLAECLGAIRAQTLPPGIEREIVIADAGSTDGTLDIARDCGADVITDNPLKTGEAGKTAGIKAAHGDVIALVDSDNILPDPSWLARMAAPFADPDVVATEPIAYTVRPQDPAPTRYFALLGMNDPICLFTRNYDRTCGVTGRWTGLSVPTEDKGEWLKLTLTADALPTIGANGFVFRRSLLDGTNWDPYLFDIDILYERIRRDGSVYVAKVKTGIVHLYCARHGHHPLLPQHRHAPPPARADAHRFLPQDRPRLALPRARMLDHALGLRLGRAREVLRPQAVNRRPLRLAEKLAHFTAESAGQAPQEGAAGRQQPPR